nr:cysteine-rich receptor-like protein kinase 10 [Malus domestica]
MVAEPWILKMGNQLNLQMVVLLLEGKDCNFTSICYCVPPSNHFMLVGKEEVKSDHDECKTNEDFLRLIQQPLQRPRKVFLLQTSLEEEVLAQSISEKTSKHSGQGIKEFSNEVLLIAKLQHRYLVKILGCCIQDEEKMLIYEYVPNKSLDSFIFDEAKIMLLDWANRFDIMYGVARGILYLHQGFKIENHP